jgi:putative ABC transport system ATP-binding protein
MVNSPRALLADEPTGALNSASGDAVLGAFRDINSAGQTILMATHEVRAACYGDRIVYLRDGAIRAEYSFAATDSGPIEKREPAVLEWLSTQGW